MDQEQWKITDEGVNKISDKLEQLLDSPIMADVKKLLGELEVKLGDRYSINLSCIVDLFDRNDEEERKKPLQLLNIGLSTSGSGNVYRTWGDSTPHRYILDGEIQVAPHDQCPKCWGDWDFKWINRSCSHCDAVLGGNCKILLDSDVCPHCEQGKVSSQNPRCEKCGFEVDPSCVVWG